MPDPTYRRIADDLRSKIESGEIARGGQLPTELELRGRYEASRNTVRDAIKWLTTCGLVETRPGQGTFVIEKIEPYITILTGEASASAGEGDIYIEEVKATRRMPRTTDPRVEIQAASGVVGKDLQVEPETQVVSRRQQRYIDGIPFSLQTSYYPMGLVEQGALRLIQAPDIREGTVTYLKSELGLSQVGYRDKISVRAPSAAEAAFFKLPDDGRVAVFEIRRTGFGPKGIPIRLTISIYPADRNQFAVIVGSVPDQIPAG
jgi:GntR family transcriptional regulator